MKITTAHLTVALLAIIAFVLILSAASDSVGLG